MRIKIDECLPHDLKGPLEALGHDVDSVFDERLVGEPDTKVFAVANLERRVLLTKDVRLVDVRLRPPGESSGLILVRMDDADRASLFARVLQVFEFESVEEWSGATVVITANKVRIRRA